MPYTPYHSPWHDDPITDTPITAAALGYIEAGIATATTGAEGAIPQTLFDAKGDLIAASAADTPVKLTVGAQNTVLTVGAASALTYQQIVDANVSASAAIARSKLATKTIRVPIQLTNPISSASAGNAFWSVLGLTDWDFGHWEFVTSVGGKVYGTVLVPHDLAGTPAAKVKLVLAANATSGVTRFSVATKNVADAASLNPTLTDETAQDVTVPATAYLRKDVSFTLTNAPAADDILIVEIFHDGAHANDTLVPNTLLLGAYLEVDVV